MPTWKIKGYWCYFKVNDITKNKPAHIHIETSRGEIEFWLEKTDTKSKDEVKIKKIQGQVSDEEKNETEKIAKKNKDLFLKEWNQRKTKMTNK
ncbi:DUF4160 domain-containing protein [endosymbiont GvMRE of Glomus versiforme]|uniref:DUF4160 domain-containing protein n=1 Tax=endosymbiont GvMRE of Glomus versiforme TaxID=2039283 RepID=UPI000ED027DD|nr:DUF4160 domain-containing protein [endosymbiont GvMRE of Glomus versiforme]RHZ35834.1 hypothetical protein GvMRE_Ic4g1 [endosymbiont GvMRE of Glomus versiforme]